MSTAILLSAAQSTGLQRLESANREQRMRNFLGELFEQAAMINDLARAVEDHWLDLPIQDRQRLEHFSATLDRWISARPRRNLVRTFTTVFGIVGLVVSHGHQVFAYPIAITRFQAAVALARRGDGDRAVEAWAPLLTPAGLDQTERIDSQRSAGHSARISREAFLARTS